MNFEQLHGLNLTFCPVRKATSSCCSTQQKTLCRLINLMCIFHQLKELQVMLSLWTWCTWAFPISNVGNEQCCGGFFLAWKKLKMHCPHFLVSSFYFSYQIWFASYDRIVFCQIPLISTPSSPAAQESCETSAAFLEALALLLVEKTPWNPDLRNSCQLWVSGSWPWALHSSNVGTLPPGAALES